MSILLLILLLISDASTRKCYYVDKVVYEHFYTNASDHRYDELLLYREYNHPGGKLDFVITDWFLVNNSINLNMENIYLGKEGRYHCFQIWSGGEYKIVKSLIYQEVTTVASKDLEAQNGLMFKRIERVSAFSRPSMVK